MHRVVILSESGAGKTEEIRFSTRRLRESGKAAFFLRIEHVLTSFEDSFEEGSYEEFERWLSSTHEGWLLLDSIDEARLRDPADFERAIRFLGRKLRVAMPRLHVVLTGRTAAWRPRSDLNLCTTHLPYHAPNKSALLDDSSDVAGARRIVELPGQPSNAPEFTVVSLVDLSEAQVRLFAQARQVSDVDALLEEVERADAWSFTTRPLDLEELLEFWTTNKRIGSRLELLRTSIDNRLREQDQTRDELSPLTLERAREGVRLIAAACTLTHQQTIAVPDGAKSVRGLPLESLLSDWSAKEIVTLLQRAVFDEEIYGTVRFHHRSTREYLTAEWFTGLLKKNTSRRAIEGLFFRTQYGLQVIAPGLRSILPWLAILDTKVQERALQVDPEVLLGDGDPSQLLLETRRRVLESTCTHTAAGAPLQWAEYSAVQRFATQDLTDDVRRLLGVHTDETCQVFLLRMVWQGRLLGVLQQSLDIALSPEASAYARQTACQAVRAVGTSDDLRRVRDEFSHEDGPLNRDVLAELLDMAPRSNDTIGWLHACLQRVDEYRQYSADHLRKSIGELVTSIHASLVPTIVENLYHLLEEPPLVERGVCDISARNAWLVSAAAVAVSRLVEGRDPAALDSASLSVLQKLPAAREYDVFDGDGSRAEVDQQVKQWPALQFALFWSNVEKARPRFQEKGERLTDWWRAETWPSYVDFSGSDFDEAVGYISSRPLDDDKLVALSLAFKLYVDLGRPPTLRNRLKAVCKDSSELRQKLQTMLHPPKLSSEALRFRRMNGEWKRKSKAQAKKKMRDLEKTQKYLQEHVDSLRNSGLGAGKVSGPQAHLHAKLRLSDKSLTMWSIANWRALETDYGIEVARAFRDGVVSFWREYHPMLISEGAAPDSTPMAVVFGLVGLAIESTETEDWVSRLSDADVEVAFRYAVRELNGFPLWFPALFQRSPATVSNLLLTEIRYELSTTSADKDSNYVLHDISWSGQWLWESLASGLLTYLLEFEPENLRHLQHSLNVIQGASIEDARIQVLAQARARSSLRIEHSAQWYAVWIGTEPELALPALLEHVDEIPDEDERAKFAMLVLTQLLGSRRNVLSRVRKAFNTAKHLKTLYIFAHDHVRTKDDIDRTEGGVYSPGLRDEAQDAREQLLSLLRMLPGKDSFVALSEIAQELSSRELRPHIEQYAKQRAEADAAGEPWSDRQVRQFHDQHERLPANHRELFDLAVLRLLDLKDDLEHGDSSDAPMLAMVASETQIRTYIGGWVRDNSRGRYAIPQEEELSDAKRPDLRFHGVSFDAPVPIELKLADNWTGPQLLERLEGQLCGDYLRDIRSGCGIFLLVYRGHKQSWDLLGEAGRVDFDGLLAALRNQWARLSPSLSNVDEIQVVGVDLTRRKQPSQQAKPP